MGKVASGENRRGGAVWEQVSCNDVVLTDVGQFFISLPAERLPSEHSQSDTRTGTHTRARTLHSLGSGLNDAIKTLRRASSRPR